MFIMILPPKQSGTLGKEAAIHFSSILLAQKRCLLEIAGMVAMEH